MKKPIEILYEDEYFLAANKPAGLLTVPNPKNQKITLSNILSSQLKNRDLFPCHRLDEETSGIVLFAKDKKTKEKMFEIFKEHKIKKEYTAFVQGCPKQKVGTIKSKINGKTSITKFKVKAAYKVFAVLKFDLITGRRNQIRIHSKKIRHPIIGDRKFSFSKDRKIKFKRCALHASEVCLKHPYTQKNILINSPLPEDMLEFLKTHIK